VEVPSVLVGPGVKKVEPITTSRSVSLLAAVMAVKGSYTEVRVAGREEVTISYKVFLRKQFPGLKAGREEQEPETLNEAEDFATLNREFQ